MLKHQKTRRNLWICFMIALILAPAYTARADIGPKATMSFEFVLPADTTLTITDGQLLECSQPDCSDAQPLQQVGPQHFSCERTACSSMAYGYTEFNQLSIIFSDGVTRQSNIFGKKYFDARYKVTVQDDSLLVEEQRGSINPMIYLGVGMLVAGVLGIAVVLALIACLVIFIVKEGQGKTSYRQAPALYIVSWVIGIPLACLGIALPMSLPITIGVEVLLLLVYLRIRKRPVIKTLTVALLMNLLTLPLLWVTMVQGNIDTFSWITLAGEILVVLVEGLILYLTHRKTMCGLEAFILAFLINLVSFGVGLLLPVSQWLKIPF